MKTILALPLLALGLASCQTYPSNSYPPDSYPQRQQQQGYAEPAPYVAPYPAVSPPRPAPNYRAIGTEPFWDLTIGRDLVFTDRGTGVAVVEQAPPAQRSASGEIYRGGQIEVSIVRLRCSDGMSDREYPDTVNVTVEGRPYRGCGGQAPYVDPTPNEGYPGGAPAQGAFNLANTNWRIVSVNGRTVPTNGHYLNFMPDRVSGSFGCNSLGAGYSVTGNLLYAGAIMATQMGCPNGSFEEPGTAIMAQPMTITQVGERLTLSNRAGTIELTRAR